MTTLDENRIVEIAADHFLKMTMDDRRMYSNSYGDIQKQLIGLSENAASIKEKVEQGFRRLDEKYSEINTTTEKNSIAIESLQDTRSQQQGSTKILSFIINAGVALGTAVTTALLTDIWVKK